MTPNQCEIEAVIDSAVEDIIEIVIAGNFTKLKDIEYGIEYLKTKIDELEPEDFLT